MNDDLRHKRQTWLDVMVEKGHTPIKDIDGHGLDMFAYEQEYCNGPGCKSCGWNICWHCFPDTKFVPTCTAVEPRN